jgi:hypothetical protein
MADYFTALRANRRRFDYFAIDVLILQYRLDVPRNLVFKPMTRHRPHIFRTGEKTVPDFL